jgi:tetratricopeptide (TPR) repeat protein
MAREGLEIASRRGSMAYGFLMVGNAVSCAIRVGEWDWASTLLDEWLANEITGDFYLELYVDRAVLTALGGGDGSDDLAEAARLVTTVEDTQYTSYCHWGRAWAAFGAGRLAEARQEATSAAQVTDYFVPISLPLAARAALWDGDATAAGAVVDRIEASIVRGQAIALDFATLRAGVAALEGRRAEAIAGYREALRGWRDLGLAFDHAMAALDMAILLAPTEREMAEASTDIEAARETLTRLEARPFLARLEAEQPVTTGSVPVIASATM